MCRVLDLLAELDELTYEVVADDLFTYRHARTGAFALTQGRNIVFPESTFDAMGDPANSAYNTARFTGAHEICHALEHHEVSASINAGLTKQVEPKAPFESAEWQANEFAAYFLMPVTAVIESGLSAANLSESCHVSREAASNMVSKVTEHHLDETQEAA